MKGVFHATLDPKKQPMETKELVILRHFLQQLESRHHDSEILEHPIDRSFLQLLSHEEMIAILVHMFGSIEDVKELYPDYVEMTKEVLLFDCIKDEYYILSYFLDNVLTKYLPK